MKYYIITYGCQMNKSDSEKIAGLLQRQGHKPAKDETSADLIVLNCCSVRQAAVHRVYDKINKYYNPSPHPSPFKKMGRRRERIKKIILAGCLLEEDKKALQKKVSEIWHPDSYFECQNPVTPSINRGISPLLTEEEEEGEFSKISYLPIMTGCNNFCSYCVVPYTRGREKSRPAQDIINEAKSLIKKGCKEIVLLGQNVNSYISKFSISNFQFSNKTRNSNFKTKKISQYPNIQISESLNFAKLLKIINDLPGDFKLSFLTSHPKDMSNELIQTMAKCEKLIKEIHLPIQSGDNQILRKMNRHYTASYYKNLIKRIRQAMPGIKISTDIIVGFPGETKKQFQNTVKLAKEIKFDKAYIAKYSPRPGTAAYRLKDDVPQEEKKRRWRILDTLINKFKH